MFQAQDYRVLQVFSCEINKQRQKIGGIALLK